MDVVEKVSVMDLDIVKEYLKDKVIPIGSQPIIEKRINSYLEELFGKYDYKLEITPMPTPRPRSSLMPRKGSTESYKCKKPPSLREVMGMLFVNVHNDPKYTQYKNDLVLLIKSCRIPKNDYVEISAVFHIPYNKTEPKKNRINGRPHRKKPDWDNYIKGLQDALEQSGVVPADGALALGTVKKKYTTRTQGYIEFSLR